MALDHKHLKYLWTTRSKKMSITDIITNSKCPFAKLAKLSEPIIVDSLDIYAAIQKNNKTISDFFIHNQITEDDALCFIFKNPEFGDTIESLSKYTYVFLTALQKQFGGFEIPEEINDYNETYWPAIAGERFFMISFASCYPPESPRFNHGDQATYILLQPVSSFERYAKDGNAITDALRNKIRKLFAANGQPYDGNISCLKNELVKMVAPLNIGDDVVEWWKRT
jgi:hypothetical protein